MGEIDIVMCWDGQTPTAELPVNGWALTGDPATVQAAFDQLNDCAARKRGTDRRLHNVRELLDKLRMEVW